MPILCKQAIIPDEQSSHFLKIRYYKYKMKDVSLTVLDFSLSSQFGEDKFDKKVKTANLKSNQTR